MSAFDDFTDVTDIINIGIDETVSSQSTSMTGLDGGNDFVFVNENNDNDFSKMLESFVEVEADGEVSLVNFEDLVPKRKLIISKESFNV